MLRHVDPRELRARCDLEVFRAIHEIFQVPLPIVSLALECQLILYRKFLGLIFLSFNVLPDSNIRRDNMRNTESVYCWRFS